MGLDNFMDDSSSSRGGQTTSTSKQKSEDKNTISEAFKVVGNGSRKKVFHTEEDWEETMEFIEEELNMNPKNVINMSPDNRHQVLHKAILGKNGMATNTFHHSRKCIVCEYEFIFPHDWDFEEFKREPVCPEHTIKEAIDAYNEINEETNIKAGLG